MRTAEGTEGWTWGQKDRHRDRGMAKGTEGQLRGQKDS